MVQDLIAALAAHALPPDLFAAITSALVLGDQALRQVERTREQAAERQRRKRAADAEARHVTSRDILTAKNAPPHPPLKKINEIKKKGERPTLFRSIGRLRGTIGPTPKRLVSMSSGRPRTSPGSGGVRLRRGTIGLGDRIGPRLGASTVTDSVDAPGW